MSKLTARELLTPSALEDALGELPGWRLDAESCCIRRRLVFLDFAEAFRFMGEVALYAERVNHHPEWCNVWNRLDVAMTTHSAGGVTLGDIEFAHEVERVASTFELVRDIASGECGGCR